LTTDPSLSAQANSVTENGAGSGEIEHSRRFLEEAIAHGVSSAAEVRAGGDIFRQMAETVSEILFSSRPDGYCEYLNRRFCEYTGLTMEESLGFGWRQVMHPEDSIGTAKRQKDAIAAGKSYEAELRLRGKDGSFRWFLGRSHPVFASDGSMERWIGTLMDIHDLKETQRRMQEGEERLRIAIDAGRIGAWEWNIVDNKIAWSDRIYEFHGIPPGSYDGTIESFVKLIHPEDASRMQSSIQEAMSTGKPYWIEFRAVRPDGSVRWLETGGRVVRDTSGKPLRMLGATMDITDRVRRQEDLETFRAISDHAHDAHFLVDENARFLYVNEAACRDLQYSEAELLSFGIADINPYYDPTGFSHLMRKLGIERVQPFEAMHRRKDGSLFPVEVSIVGIMYRGKECSFSIVRDITERKRAEGVLRESEERLRFALTASKLVAWNWSLAGDGVSVSENALEVLGIDPSVPLKGAVADAWIHPDDQLAHKTLVAAAVASAGGEYVSQFRLVRPDDKRMIWVEDRGRVTLDEAGNIIRVGGVILDITERKVTEEAVRMLNTELEQKVEERTRNLKATLERIKQMIAHMPIGAIAVDENGVILQVNDMCCAMLRLEVSSEEMIGHSAKEFSQPFLSLIAEPQGHSENLQKLMNEKRLAMGQEIRLRDGRVLLRDYIPIFENGKFHGNLTLYRDVTQERRIDATKSEFMSLASHQLRTPLTAVRWTLGRLEKSLADRALPFEKHLLEEGRKGAIRMTQTIDTMLQISRIEAGTVQIRPVEIELEAFIKEVIALQENDMRSKQQDIRIDCPDRLRIETDISFLQEILSNLFSNAVKYTPPKGDIRVKVQAMHGSVRIDVSDTGYGIPEHQQVKIFRKFFRGDNVVSRDTEGTGLGLYLASLMTHLLDGTLSFRSKEGEGTTFTLVLPLRRSGRV
jgi:PAS domain S-box-containing protein